MGLEDLSGQIVGLDTAPLIFFIEDKKPEADYLAPFFSLLQSGNSKVVTSIVTITEVLVHPLRQNNEKLASEYLDILLSHPHILALPVTSAIAQHAAELRAQYSLKTVDAIQLATAFSQNATTFLTNDRDFRNVPGIRIIRLVDLKSAQ
jgi:predicted nucleic acid-binding protein